MVVLSVAPAPVICVVGVVIYSELRLKSRERSPKGLGPTQLPKYDQCSAMELSRLPFHLGEFHVAVPLEREGVRGKTSLGVVVEA